MVEKKKFSSLSIITLVTFVIMVTLNVLANALPINGRNTGEISDSYSNLFAPAGYTFAIWGLIYLLLGMYTIYQLGFFRKGEVVSREPLLSKINVLFSLTSVANTIWILAWHYDFIGLSTVLIAFILICLILINLEIKKTKDLSLKERVFLCLPFSVYFGWLTVATVANITTLLVSIGWKGFGIGEDIWTMIILIVAFLIAGVTIMRLKNIPYGLVLIWSYVGIYSKHISKDGWNSQYPVVTATVTVCLVLFVLVLLYTAFISRKRAVNE